MIAPFDSIGVKTYRMPTLHRGQHEIRRSPARFKVVICGRRWGKTRLGAAMATAEALAGGRAWWVAPTYKIANEGWVLLRRLARCIPGARVSKSERTVTMPGGGTAEVRSADNPDSLVGAGLTLAVLDECADMQAEAWGESLRPALADRAGRAMFITTPKGFANWIYTDLWKRCDDDPRWQRWQMPTWTNPFIAPSEVDEMRHDMSPARFSQEIAAEFTSMEGRVFPDFTRERHVRPTPFERNLPVIVGWDFGYRTTALVAAQPDTKGCLRIFSEADWKECSTEQGIARARQLPWADAIEEICCDPAGDAHDVQTGLKDVELLRKAFPKARVRFSTNPPHRKPEYRAGLIRDLLWTAAGDRRIQVDPACHATIQMFEASVYPEARIGSGEKAEPVKDGIVDHNRDALGYLVVNVFHRQPVTVGRRPW